MQHFCWLNRLREGYGVALVFNGEITLCEVWYDEVMDMQTTFNQAEQERQFGDTKKAIELYREVVKAGGELAVPARHMLAVALMDVGRRAMARREYEALLAEDLDERARGNVLRDYGYALTKAKKFDEADEALTQAEKVLEAAGDAAGRAAVIGFRARNFYAAGKTEAAIGMADEAAEALKGAGNEQYLLYHDIFRATLYAVAGRAVAARMLAQSTLGLAGRVGKPEHAERLRLIMELADQPKELKARLDEIEAAEATEDE